ncbi:unnamed protein product [Lupinus luteus]|uniref:BZIP domain-containing protein n=1 Tax=Lupinus luteus TaxID=3873 RepID=A0AAV1XVU1_LUPLU
MEECKSHKHVPIAEINDVAKMNVKISISPKEMSTRRSIVRPEDSTLGHTHSLHVDSRFNTSTDDENKSGGNEVSESDTDHRHQKSSSVDVSRSPFLATRVMPPERLAELGRTDPKKAKRIIANRKSAVKSKERKKFYENELHIQVKSLQSQVDNVYQQLLVTKRNVTTRIAWNSTLRKEIDAKRQELYYRRARYEAMKNEMEYYKMKTSQFAADMANDASYHDMVSKFCSGLSIQHDEDPMQSESCLPPLPPSPLPFGQPLNDEPFGSDFVDFNVFE